LTTVHQKLVEAGRIAVQALHKMIKAHRQLDMPVEATSMKITPELIVRLSSFYPEPDRPVWNGS
jgi:DNA-binding LacI/PurR family transcriptional regulator